MAAVRVKTQLSLHPIENYTFGTKVEGGEADEGRVVEEDAEEEQTV